MPRIPAMNRILVSPFLLLAIVAGFLAGCYSTDRHEWRNRSLSSTVKRAEEAPAILTGDQIFFDGRLKVTALVSRGLGGPGGPGGEHERSLGHFGMGHRMDRDRSAPEDYSDEDSPGPRPTLGESHLPPVMIRLKFENLTDGPLTVDVFDFTSPLGNFVVDPEMLSIPAHAIVEPHAMTSRLGLAGEGLFIKLILHLNGQRDERTIRLAPKGAHPPGHGADSGD